MTQRTKDTLFYAIITLLVTLFVGAWSTKESSANHDSDLAKVYLQIKTGQDTTNARLERLLDFVCHVPARVCGK